MRPRRICKPHFLFGVFAFVFAFVYRVDLVDSAACSSVIAPAPPPPLQRALLLQLNSSQTVGDSEGHDINATATEAITLDSGDFGIIVNGTCNGSACIKAAEEMIGYMNLSANPCHDFYDYACGRYAEAHTIPSDETEVSVFHEMGRKLLDDLQDLLDSDENETSTARNAAKELYQLCLDEDAVEELGARPLLDLLNKTVGGWPMLTPDWNPASFELWKVLGQLDHIGLAPLMLAGIMADLHNASQNVLSVGIASGFSKNLLSSELGKKYIKRYPKLMMKITKLLANSSYPDAVDIESRFNWTEIGSEIQKIVDIYLFLTNLSTTTMESRDFEKFYNVMNISTVKEQYFYQSNFSKGLTWFLRNALEPGNLQHMVNDSMRIVIPKPAALRALDEKMAELEAQGEKGKRLLANFVGWRLIASFGRDLSKPYEHTFEEQDRILSGTNDTDPTWKSCIYSVAAAMPLALGSMYVDDVLDDRVKPRAALMFVARNARNYADTFSLACQEERLRFGPLFSFWRAVRAWDPFWTCNRTASNKPQNFGTNSNWVWVSVGWVRDQRGSRGVTSDRTESGTNKVTEMVADIRRSFQSLLQKAPWMEDTTRIRALKKLEMLMEYVTHPEFFLTNQSRIDHIYENVSIGETMFQTSIDLARAANIRHVKRLTRLNLREDVFERLYTVTNNAQYLPQSNFIAIFAGVTQAPMFDVNVPQYLNYGGLGYIIGHEITHAFDDIGSRFDETGHMVDWWSSDSKKAYKEKAAAIVLQYSQYRTPFGKVNGNLTLSENIADAGGLKTAYYAYKMYAKRRGLPEPRLPGLQNHTAEQTFFLSSAQVWCGMQRPEQEELNLIRDSHSPSRFRVNGPLSSFPQFAEAYHCSPTDLMVSNHSTGLW